MDDLIDTDEQVRYAIELPIEPGRAWELGRPVGMAALLEVVAALMNSNSNGPPIITIRRCA